MIRYDAAHGPLINTSLDLCSEVGTVTWNMGDAGPAGIPKLYRKSKESGGDDAPTFWLVCPKYESRSKS